MHSHSFQDKKFNLHRNVNDSSGQVVETLERLTIRLYDDSVGYDDSTVCMTMTYGDSTVPPEGPGIKG